MATYSFLSCEGNYTSNSLHGYIKLCQIAVLVAYRNIKRKKIVYWHLVINAQQTNLTFIAHSITPLFNAHSTWLLYIASYNYQNDKTEKCAKSPLI